MVTNKITLTANNVNDVSIVRKFAENLYSHPMYPTITEVLYNTEGFVQKKHTIIETKENTTFVNETQFRDKETFDNYFTDPSIISLYEYIEKLALEENINFQKETIID